MMLIWIAVCMMLWIGCSGFVAGYFFYYIYLDLDQSDCDFPKTKAILYVIGGPITIIIIAAFLLIIYLIFNDWFKQEEVRSQLDIS